MTGIKKRSVIAVTVLLLGMSLMVYAGGRLAETQQTYQQGNEAYEYLREQIKGSVPNTVGPPTENVTPGLEPPQENTGEPSVYIPSLDINFEKLKSINKDAAAWLYCPDTVIDYPIMRANDYNYYLNRLPDGTNNSNGSLFLDFNCSPDFSDQLSVIYGHNMKSGSMFGSLKGYKDQKYYEKHPYMYLYTEQGNYRIDLIYGCVIAAGKWRERAFMFEENLGELIAYAANNTTFNSGINYTEGDRIIALSTCSYEFDDARYVVLGILTPEY